MPVLEAMASGLPIVTTDCFGVRSFATHGVNCLMADPNDLNTLAVYVIALCEDTDLRMALSKRARETAKQFSMDRVVDTLEAVLYSLTACSEELHRAKQASIPDLQVHHDQQFLKTVLFYRWHVCVQLMPVHVPEGLNDNPALRNPCILKERTD